MLNLPNDFINYISSYAYLILIFIILQGSLILILGYIFFEKVITSKKRKKEETIIKEEAYQEALKTLDKANEESLRILLDSEQKARNILKDSGSMSIEAKEKISSELEGVLKKHKQEAASVSKQLLNIYKEAIDNEKNRSIEEISKVSTILKDEVMSEIGSMKDVLKKETIETENDLKQKIKNEYDQIKIELAQYKEKKLNDINSYIYEIITQTSKDIIGKAMSIDDQEDLIIQALEEAKEENKFMI